MLQAGKGGLYCGGGGRLLLHGLLKVIIAPNFPGAFLHVSFWLFMANPQPEF